jgi:predicted MFS family arabinose efflux permease
MTAPAAPRFALLVPALGISQIVSWGTLYYAIAVLSAPMRAELQMTEPVFFAAFTLSLLVSGLVAPTIGRWIDTRGARGVMSGGSLLAAAAFVLLATATGSVAYFLGWIVAGLAMAATLYEASFAALNQLAGSLYRRTVTALTLFGGFASSVFWPLTHYLSDAIGWRQTLFVYAGLHLLICFPVHRWMLPRRTGEILPHSSESAEKVVAPLSRTFVLLAAAFACGAFVFSVLSVYLIEILKTRGLSAGEAVLVSSLIGPAQVAGRVAEFALGDRLRATLVGTVSFCLSAAALTALWWLDGFSFLAFVFVLFYGMSNGIMTIVRGTVPAQLFGRSGYGALLGRFAVPVFVSKALAPMVFSLLLASLFDYRTGVLVLTACVVVGLITYQCAIGKRYRRD